MIDSHLQERVQKLIGAELIQVCFGASDTQLHFHNGISIFQDLSFEVAHFSRDGSADIRDFLGCSVVNALFVDETAMQITFSNDGVLKALSDEHTSFRILIDGEELEIR